LIMSVTALENSRKSVGKGVLLSKKKKGKREREQTNGEKEPSGT